MDERKRKLFEMEVSFIERKYGVHLVALPSRKDKDEAILDIRLGRESKTHLLQGPALNEALPC